MEPRTKFWIEHDGQAVLGDFRARLLRLIDETGSLSAAAAQAGLSYRRAWGKVREIERNSGFSVVESAAGGASGGGSHLTADGLRLLHRYEQFRDAADAAVAAEFRRAFGAGAGGPDAT